MSSKPIVVIGNGWSALGAVGFLVASGIEVHWVTGTGPNIWSPLACLEWGPGVAIWAELASKLQVQCGEYQQGSFVREYRTKAFRPPLWVKSPTPEARAEVRNEVLWEPERRWVGAFDSRFAMPLSEIEDAFRAILTPQKFLNLKVTEGVPATGFKKDGSQVEAVLLGSGKELKCSQVIFADRWSLVSQLEGSPKLVPLLRKRDPMGIFQACFTHDVPVAVGVSESFYSALHKESGENIEKHVWGHFSNEGTRSIWTLCLSQEEVEDNHIIAKKFRRMKTLLDRVFTGTSWIPEGRQTFGSTIVAEQVRFGEEAVYADGDPLTEPLEVSGLNGVLFLTDGYGPSYALAQVGSALGVTPQPVVSETVLTEGATPQAESVDVVDSPTL